MNIRIGAQIIPTNNWSVEDYDTVIRELRIERARLAKAEELRARMNELLADAKAEGFDFIDKDCGYVHVPDDFVVYNSH